jgi:hypothetical protein
MCSGKGTLGNSTSGSGNKGITAIKMNIIAIGANMQIFAD